MNNVVEMHERTDECECPICDNGTLDTGGECNSCDYDRKHVMDKHEFTQAWLKVRNKPKATKIAFMRNHGNYGGKCS